MSVNDDIETRIRHRARQHWAREGCPEGRADAHWAQAKEEIALEEVERAARNPAQP
ncbi:MAG TPA: DUF2934 domain-containing protein [Stellaceae bacterium]|nr:DUF2934 domain-containing protein [Stellaceae bacterium]